MTALALNEAYHTIDTISDGLAANFKTTVLQIATDELSTESSKKIVEKLSEVEAALPTTIDALDIEKAKAQLKSCKKNLSEISKLFKVIGSLITDSDKCELTDHSHALLANLESAKKKLEYICEYLQLLLQIHASEEDYNDYELSELIEFVVDGH